MRTIEQRFLLMVSFIPGLFIWLLTLIMTFTDMHKVFLNLDLPFLMPSRFLYILLWLITYGILGAATYNMVSSRAFEDQKRNALILYYGGMLLNILWPFVLWNLRRFGLALLVIMLLDLSMAACIISYHRIRPLAGTLLMIGGVWYLFLTYLNFGIIILN